jgi:hypothetical protein
MPRTQGYRIVLSGQTEDGWRVTRTHYQHAETGIELPNLVQFAAEEIRSMPVSLAKLRSFKIEVKVS